MHARAGGTCHAFSLPVVRTLCILDHDRSNLKYISGILYAGAIGTFKLILCIQQIFQIKLAFVHFVETEQNIFIVHNRFYRVYYVMVLIINTSASTSDNTIA